MRRVLKHARALIGMLESPLVLPLINVAFGAASIALIAVTLPRVVRVVRAGMFEGIGHLIILAAVVAFAVGSSVGGVSMTLSCDAQSPDERAAICEDCSHNDGPWKECWRIWNMLPFAVAVLMFLAHGRYSPLRDVAEHRR